MLALLALAAAAAAPIDPVVACQASQSAMRTCPIRAESTPSYLEEYENGNDSVPSRLQLTWVSPTRLHAVNPVSGFGWEIDLDSEGNPLKQVYSGKAYDSSAFRTKTYSYHAGRLDSVAWGYWRYHYWYANGMLDSVDVAPGESTYERTKEYYKYTYDPQGQVRSVLDRMEDSLRNTTSELRTEYAYHWPDSVTTKSTSSYWPGDTTYGTVYLRDGVIRKKVSRGGYPLSITYMLSYWYAGETPGSLARAIRPFARPTYGNAVDALGIRYPAAGLGARGRMMYPAGERRR